MQAECINHEVPSQERKHGNLAERCPPLAPSSFRGVPRVSCQSCQASRCWSKRLGSFAFSAGCTSVILSEAPWKSAIVGQQQASPQSAAAAVHLATPCPGGWGLCLHPSEDKKVWSSRPFGAQVLPRTSLSSLDWSDRCYSGTNGAGPSWWKWWASNIFSESLLHGQIHSGSHPWVCQAPLSWLVCWCLALAPLKHWGELHGFRLPGFPPHCFPRLQSVEVGTGWPWSHEILLACLTGNISSAQHQRWICNGATALPTKRWDQSIAELAWRDHGVWGAVFARAHFDVQNRPYFSQRRTFVACHCWEWGLWTIRLASCTANARTSDAWKGRSDCSVMVWQSSYLWMWVWAKLLWLLCIAPIIGSFMPTSQAKPRTNSYAIKIKTQSTHFLLHHLTYYALCWNHLYQTIVAHTCQLLVPINSNVAVGCHFRFVSLALLH